MVVFVKWDLRSKGNQGPAGYLLAETAKTLDLRPIGRQTVCIIGSVLHRLNGCSLLAPDPKSVLTAVCAL